MNKSSKDIEEKIRKIINRVKSWYGGTSKERDNGLNDDGAVEHYSRIKEIPTKTL